MKIKLNGEGYNTQVRNIYDLLMELDIIPGRVAVELNLKIIKSDSYTETRIEDGDHIEVVSFVGGGSKVTMCNKRRLYGR